MQEMIESSLLIVVAILSIILLLIGQRPNSGMTKKQKIMLGRILTATVLLLVLQTLGSTIFDQLGAAGRWVRLALYLVDYLIIGYDILRKAYKGIRNGQVFDENFLMAVATIGALALAGIHCSYAVLSGRRMVPVLCCWQISPQHKRTHGHPSRLR